MGINLVHWNGKYKKADSRLMTIYLGGDKIVVSSTIISEDRSHRDYYNWEYNYYNDKYIDKILDSVNDHNIDIVEIYGCVSCDILTEDIYINHVLDIISNLREAKNDIVITLSSDHSYIDLITRCVSKETEIATQKILHLIDYLTDIDQIKSPIDVKATIKANNTEHKDISINSLYGITGLMISDPNYRLETIKPCIHGNLCRKYFDRHHVIYSTSCPKCDMYVPKED